MTHSKPLHVLFALEMYKHICCLMSLFFHFKLISNLHSSHVRCCWNSDDHDCRKEEKMVKISLQHICWKNSFFLN